ncbi:MAG: hypothetical protein ACI37Q_01845 [Candidatus Gastranaerophilaceae bacterium]
MNIQKIQNQPSFNGIISISENLSPKLRGDVAKAVENIDISQKPYDLFIKNVGDDNFIAFQLVSPKAENEKYTVMVHKNLQKGNFINDSLTEVFQRFEHLFTSKKN